MAKKAYIGVDGKARKVKSGYIGIENFAKRNLPSGYTQVEYIESAGKQYVDTGFTPNQDTRVVAKVLFETGTATKYLLGARTSSSSSDMFVLVGSANGYYASGYGKSTSLDTSFNRSVPFVLEKNKNVTYIDGEVAVTAEAATFTAPNSMYLFGVNQNGSAKLSSSRFYYCRIYDSGVLVRDYVPCTNSAGVAGLYDVVNGTFSGSASATAFVAGSSTHTSVAHKIKKAYIGIGGVARPCWSGGELAYYGTITSLKVGRYNLAAASNDNYAIFAGGYGGGFAVNNVDAYNKSYTRSSPTAIDKRSGIQGASVGGYAVFGGGSNLGTTYGTTYAYDASLTRTKPTAFRDARYALASTTVGNYALFGGGRTRTVDAYNASLTREAVTDLSYYMEDFSAATVGDYALFPNPGGGTTDVYNKSLTKTTTYPLSQTRYGFAATTVGDFAIFTGGSNGSNYDAHNYYTYYSTADAYDSSLTKHSPAAMNTSRFHHAATTIGNFALFAGGGWSVKATVTCYNAELTRLDPPPALGEARYKLAATTLGECALFAGGTNGIGSDFTTVDAYIIA